MTTGDDKAGDRARVVRAAGCPICGRPSVAAYRPFCSRRCGDVDLNRWLSGRYAVPVAEDEDDTPPPSKPGHEN